MSSSNEESKAEAGETAISAIKVQNAAPRSSTAVAIIGH